MFMTGVTAAPRAVPVTRMPASLGLLPLADVADGERRDGWPERVIRRKDAVIPMTVPPGRRHKVGEPVEKLKRRELDDAIDLHERAAWTHFQCWKYVLATPPYQQPGHGVERF